MTPPPRPLLAGGVSEGVVLLLVHENFLGRAEAQFDCV